MKFFLQVKGSPKLKAQGKAVVYWQHKLSLLKHPDMPHDTLDPLQKAAGISEDLHQATQTINQCAKHLHQAWTALKTACNEALNLCEQHLMSTADYLTTDGNNAFK